MKHIAVTAVTLALFAAACGSTSNTDSTAAPADPPQTATLVTSTSTQPPTTTTATPETTTTGVALDADQAAIALAYDIVFSSETTYDEKVPYLEKPDGLEETVLKYQQTGETVGGVSLAATSITVTDAVAEVIYDFLFAGTPTYPDQIGDAVFVDGTWVITREMFCSIMTSARVNCPAQ